MSIFKKIYKQSPNAYKVKVNVELGTATIPVVVQVAAYTKSKAISEAVAEVKEKLTVRAIDIQKAKR